MKCIIVEPFKRTADMDGNIIPCRDLISGAVPVRRNVSISAGNGDDSMSGFRKQARDRIGSDEMGFDAAAIGCELKRNMADERPFVGVYCKDTERTLFCERDVPLRWCFSESGIRVHGEISMCRAVRA